MHQTTGPITCPAPSTASPTALHAIADELRSGAVISTAPASATATRRKLTASCTCARRYRGESITPLSVSVLSLPSVADQDIADAVGVALCRLRSAAVIAERDGEDMSAAVQLATQYIDRAEKHLLTPRGITVGVEHAL